MKPWLKYTIVAVVALSIIITATSYIVISGQLGQAINVSKVESFAVQRGDTLTRIATKLQQQGIIERWWAIRIWAKVNNSLSQVKAGLYELQPNQSFEQVLDAMIAGQEIQFSFTILEGDNLYQVLDKAKSSLHLDNDLFGLDHQQVAKALGLEYTSAEGWLAPNTYHYTAGTKASELLLRAVEAQRATVTKTWAERSEEATLTSPYQMLILASIIEKESAIGAERGKISSVFHNRLKKRMRLQTDPTVIYGVWPKYNGDITRQHLNEMTPYNTYRINGLPPTPIANPSQASMQAALMPEKTDYLYFVASGDGDHVFTTNLDDHNRAVRSYLKKQRILSLKEPK